MSDYPSRWPSFFDDLLQSLSFGTVAVDIYLRVLMSIDSEVVDREIVHTVQVCRVQKCLSRVFNLLVLLNYLLDNNPD